MDWYKRRPQSYRADTWDLTLAEHGAYNLLIDHYYETERPLPLQDQALASICGVSVDKWLEVKDNVTRYFVVTNAGLRHEVCDKVIDDALGSRSGNRKRQDDFRKRLKNKETVTRLSRVSNAPRGEKSRLEESPPPYIPPHSEGEKPINGKGHLVGRGTRWSSGQKVPQEWIDEAMETLPSLERRLHRQVTGFVDVKIEAIEFENYWSSVGGQKGCKLDWRRTWQNRIIEVAKRAPLERVDRDGRLC